MRTQAPKFEVVNPGQYRLEEDYDVPYNTGILGYQLNIPMKFALNKAGWMVVKKGFLWDGPSGPAINTVSCMGASLAHDALYGALRKRYIIKSHKKAADKLYRRMLKGAGVGYVRRWYHWAAVAVFGRV
jgi:hypothetical protein